MELNPIPAIAQTQSSSFGSTSAEQIADTRQAERGSMNAKAEEINVEDGADSNAMQTLHEGHMIVIKKHPQV